MTAFPAITPSSRAFTPGQYANTPFEALSGGQTRVRHSDAYAAAQLQLTFAAISEADMLAIWNHFINRTGTFQSFTLPAEVFSQDDAIDYTAQSAVWIYASSGVVEDLPCGGHNVQLELRTVPSANVVLIGIAIGVSIKLVAGAAAAANGAQLTVGVSIEIGGIWILGLASTVTASLSTVGTATGGVGVSGEGVIAEIRASLNPGFAFAGLSRVFNVVTSLAAGNAANITDSDYQDVELLIHGWNGFVDNSLRQRAITANSGVTLTSTGPRFGSQSIQLPDGNNDYFATWGGNVTIQRPWTVEAWIYVTTLASSRLICIVTPVTNTTVNDNLQVTTAGRLLVRLGSNTDEFLQTNTDVVKVNTWHHVAASADDTTLRLFVDGDLLASRSRPSNRDYALTLGQVGPKVDRLQEFRLTAKCRYTATFAKPLMSFSSLAGITHAALDGIASTVTATRTGGTATGAADTAGIAETVDATLAEGAASSP